MTDSKPDKALVKNAKGEVAPDQAEAAPTSRLSWIVGWVLVPATLLGLIFGGGVAVGVHLHDSWFTSMIVWIVELFV